jgi:hypothetical protein
MHERNVPSGLVIYSKQSGRRCQTITQADWWATKTNLRDSPAHWGHREAASKTICYSSVVAVGPLPLPSCLVLEAWRTMATRRWKNICFLFRLFSLFFMVKHQLHTKVRIRFFPFHPRFVLRLASVESVQSHLPNRSWMRSVFVFLCVVLG